MPGPSHEGARPRNGVLRGGGDSDTIRREMAARTDRLAKHIALVALLHGAAAAAQQTPPEPPTQPANVPPPPPPDAAPPPPPAPAATPAAPAAQGPRTAVVDAAPIGVDPAAARFVTETLRARAAELGFNVIPTQELYAAASRLQLPFPVPPEGIFELERVLQAPVALHAEVRASHGQYLVRLRVRIAVERAERVQEVSANQFQLAESLRQALPPLLVPPRADAAVAPAPPSAPVDLVGQAPAAPTPRRRVIRAHPRRWEVGAGVIGAFGPGQDAFANALVLARARYFPIDRFGVSVSFGYANLRGRDERVSNVLMLAGVETSVDLVSSSRIFIPLRFEAGYLPNNGPVFRLTAGVAFNLARRVRMEIDIISPTIWVLPDTSPVTLDLGAHVSFAL